MLPFLKVCNYFSCLISILAGHNIFFTIFNLQLCFYKWKNVDFEIFFFCIIDNFRFSCESCKAFFRRNANKVNIKFDEWKRLNFIVFFILLYFDYIKNIVILLYNTQHFSGVGNRVPILEFRCAELCSNCSELCGIARYYRTYNCTQVLLHWKA